MAVDYDFNNMDFGDYKLKRTFHDIISDTINMLSRFCTDYEGKMCGEIESVDFDAENNQVEISASLVCASLEPRDIISLYADRLYGCKIPILPSSEYDFTIKFYFNNCFYKPEDQYE